MGHPIDGTAGIASGRVFRNLDGVRFLTHQGGCGGTRQDAQALCGLLAGYIHHPNVAGATVLSLGCQNAQASMLMDELRRARSRNCASRCWSSISTEVGTRIGADEGARRNLCRAG
jgi:altronate hydrolase